MFGTRAMLAPAMMALSLQLMLGGCHRSEYRQEADQEVCELVAEKSYDGRWGLQDFNIETDPRSRYADVYDRDFPPMPPDDPASHELMHCIDGKEHWDGWHDSGDIDELENPGWREYLKEYARVTEDGKIKLSLEDAVRLAVMHSPSYQQQRETLYLSALDVSTERFRFDVQFFGGNGSSFQHLGQERTGGESNLVTSTTAGQARRRFATAGEMLIGFANSLTWEFMGGNASTATSAFDFAFVQPLLRAGGRVIALEQLTIAERGLLANLRAYQRYRKGYYTSIAIGSLGVSGPQRRGGFFGGTGLTGFTGQGAGGLGGVGAATGFGGRFGGGAGGATGGTAGLAGGGAGTVGGFIGLLQQLQQIRNTEDSLRAQLRTLALLEANLEAGLIDIAQVDQFRQNIETERANLLQAKNGLASSLDSFKRSTIGLPPNMPIDLDDSMIQQFQLIDPDMNSAQGRITAFIDEFGQLQAEPSDAQFAAAFARIEQLRADVDQQLKTIPRDLADLDRVLPQRMAVLTELEAKFLRSERNRMNTGLQELTKRWEETAQVLKELSDKLNDTNREATAVKIVELLTELSNIVGELGLIQARARLETITLDPVEITESAAMQIARGHRLDWMNNRAALVDTWRLIEFNANALQTDVSIRFDGDLQTIGNDNPTKFRDQTGSLRASLQIDPPFTRLLERNNFRQQLIQYQQDRRQMIQFEDELRQNLRQIIRDVNQLKVNLEIQRRAVSIAIRRVDQTREALSQPVPPAQPGQLPQSFGPTAAQNLLFALSDLRNTQNNLMSVWLNYLATRMLLYRELGVLQVDNENLWIDVPLSQVVPEEGFELEQVPEIPREWIRELKKFPAVPPAPVDGAPKLQPVPKAPAAGSVKGAAYRRSSTSTGQTATGQRSETGWLRLRRWFGEKSEQARPSRRRELAKRESNRLNPAMPMPRSSAAPRPIPESAKIANSPVTTHSKNQPPILGSRLPTVSDGTRPVIHVPQRPSARRRRTLNQLPPAVSEGEIQQLVDEVRESAKQRTTE